MNKPVLVLVLSKTCGACANFKRKILPELEQEFGSSSNVNLVILDFPEMAIPSFNPSVGNYHPGLRNGFVHFFPSVALFPSNLWNDHKSSLKGVVKHGDEENPKIDYSKPGIVNWVNDTIKRNPLFDNYKSHENYIVPTYGQFHSSKIDESELYN